MHWAAHPHPPTRAHKRGCFTCGIFPHILSWHILPRPQKLSAHLADKVFTIGCNTDIRNSMWRSTGTPKLYQLRMRASPVAISVTIYPATCPPSHRTTGVYLLAALNLGIWVYDQLFVCVMDSPPLPSNSRTQAWVLRLWYFPSHIIIAQDTDSVSSQPSLQVDVITMHR